ncbi:MAG TPA: hypothetical protein VFE42_31945 [Chloroflexota bacterium]|nr:hypothetical protein [Chloroflexota bacterium]
MSQAQLAQTPAAAATLPAVARRRRGRPSTPLPDGADLAVVYSTAAMDETERQDRIRRAFALILAVDPTPGSELPRP